MESLQQITKMDLFVHFSGNTSHASGSRKA